MAEVVTNTQVVLKVTDAEWRLIMKSLALAAGLKIPIKIDDQARAAELNQALLKQRRDTLKTQLEQAEKKLQRALEGIGEGVPPGIYEVEAG